MGKIRMTVRTAWTGRPRAPRRMKDWNTRNDRENCRGWTGFENQTGKMGRRTVNVGWTGGTGRTSVYCSRGRL